MERSDLVSCISLFCLQLSSSCSYFNVYRDTGIRFKSGLVASNGVYAAAPLSLYMTLADVSHRFFFTEGSVTVTCISEPCRLRYRVYHSALGQSGSMKEVVGFGGFGGHEWPGLPCIWRLLLIYPRLCIGDFDEVINCFPPYDGQSSGRCPIVSPSCWTRSGGGMVEHPVSGYAGSLLPFVCIDFDWSRYYRAMRVLYLSQGDVVGLAIMQEAFMTHHLLSEIPAWKPTGIPHIDQ